MRASAVAMDLAAELRAHGIADVSVSDVDRAAYSSDASLFRIVPRAVVRARHVDDLHAAHTASRRLGIPLTLRGSGTSIAGNAIGPGIVVDTRALDRVIAIDPEARTATVEPGVVHADLQRAAVPYGLRFGPDPSSHARATIGGMIGNNACGSRALGYGRTVDNVESLEVIWGAADADAGIARDLEALAETNLATIRTQFGRFGRQVSGYSLEHLLPERRSIPKFLVGTEGTLATITQATVRLVAAPAHRLLVALGYPDMAHAADAVPAIRAGVAGLESSSLRLTALEGMDARILDLVRAKGTVVPELPRGTGWLFAELGGESLSALEEAARRVIDVSGALGARIVSDVSEQDALWRIREDGGGLAGRALPTPAHSGWEDSAVPPEHLGAWLRDFEELLEAHGLQGIPYGHFGDGCIHCRIDFPFQPGDPASATVFRDFMHAAAEALRKYGGTISGEHGDGRARSELLPYMYDETALRLFAEVKRICDPENLLNPGVIADPDAPGAADLTDDLRPVRPRARPRTALALLHDGGDLGAAVHRCTGVGKCVAPHPAGVMCPSYLATKNERDSTRGRARVLQEALDGGLLREGLADDAVAEALDLCLACKGCSTDCPSGVDMATYKSEALHQKHDVSGVRRPRTHLTLGRLPLWARLCAPVATAVNLAMKLPPAAAIGKWVMGIDQRRSVPTFAPKTLRRAARSERQSPEPDVWIWADSFTDHFFPQSGHAALAYLRAQGLTARVIPDDACCGLTWITTGQLDRAREITARTVERLVPYVDSGIPVLGLEPSCTATLRSDVVELVDTPEARRVAEGVRTFAELVTAMKLPVPDLTGVEVVAQPHCHQNAVLGWSADESLLRSAGATVTRVDGCCGLAGNFGVEKGHYEVSVAVAETNLLPAAREHPDAIVLADGMSCRIQVDDLTGRDTMHLAELLASRL